MIVNTSFTNRVYQHQRGMKLLDLLKERFTYRTRESWSGLIEEGVILLNGKQATAEAVVATDDEITYIVKNYNEPDVPTDYSIEYEDADVVVVTKPAQVPVQQTGKIIYNTMTNMLRRDLDNSAIVPFHRIDRETSGLIVFAKNSEFCRNYQKHVATVLNRKFYLALVAGRAEYRGTRISLYLGEKEGSAIRTKMYVDAGKRQLSESTFYTINSSDTHSLLLIEIHTGRKHQIRAQCEHAGHSIIGDKIYSHGGLYYLRYLQRDLLESEVSEIGASRLLLHSFTLDLHIPGKEPVLITSTKTCSEFERYADQFGDWKQRAIDAVTALLKSTNKSIA